MKLRCERDALAETVSAASRAVSSRGGSLPVLSGVRLDLVGDQLTVTGSDLDLTIEARVSVAGDTDGVVVMPARLATDILRLVPEGKVEIDSDDSEARITAGRSQFAVRVIPADEFPQLAEPSGDAVTLAAAEFSQALRQVVPAASSDDSRPILTGVSLAAEAGGLRLVATDSYRLAVRDLPGVTVLSEGQDVLIPSRALAELQKVLGSAEEVTLRLGERDASFEIGDTRLTTRLIEGDFPNYRNLIPESHPNRLTIGREVLLEAVKRMRIMATDATPVRLVQKADVLELRTMSQDVGTAQEELDAKYEGAELEVAFNPTYLIEGIEVTPGDEILLESIDSLKPALLRSTESSSFKYVLMPVRVS